MARNYEHGGDTSSIVLPRSPSRFEAGAGAVWLSDADPEPDLSATPSQGPVARRERAEPSPPTPPADPISERLIVRETLTVREPLPRLPGESSLESKRPLKSAIVPRKEEPPGGVVEASSPGPPRGHEPEQIEAIRSEESTSIIVRVEAVAPAPVPITTAPLLPSRVEERRRGPDKGQPIVRVTIGRIEVNTPPGPPRQPAPRQAPTSVRPVRTLDDYLRQRRGGQR